MIQMYLSFTFTLILVALTSGARILSVYPIPSPSHHIVYRDLTKELAIRHHDLTVATPYSHLPKDWPLGNVREIDLFDASENIFRLMISNLTMQQTSPVKDFHNIILKACIEYFDAQLNVPDLKELVRNRTESFDLLILECVLRGPFFFTHRFKAPVIGVSTMMGMQFNYDVTGTPSHPMYYTDMFHYKIDNFTLWDKVYAAYLDTWQRYAYWSRNEEDNRVGRKHFGDDTPDVSEVVYNMDLMFLNVHPLWEGVRPIAPSIIYVGGLHIRKEEELPTELKSYLDSCSRGVVYMSLGSNVKSAELPPERVQMFLRVFTELQYCVLWKWEADELPGRPDNVKIAKWLPQTDLLRHPNILAFITQCGLQSTDEAIEAAVPLVGIPFLGDQEKNAQKYEFLGIGVALHGGIFTEKILRRAIQKVINDKSYKRNIARLKRLMYDEPMSSMQRAVWWTEYVLRHGGAQHLRSPGATASLNDTYALDVLAALAATTIFFTYFVMHALRILYRLPTYR